MGRMRVGGNGRSFLFEPSNCSLGDVFEDGVQTSPTGNHYILYHILITISLIPKYKR